MTMAKASRISFSVTRGEPHLVAPARPTPREKKPLSDIDDQEGLKFHVPVIFFYRERCLMGGRGKDPAMVIKEAVGEALVYYYPFAGRLVEVGDGKLAVDCTGEGLLFVEADADTTIDHLGDAIMPPCPYLEELLYDVPGSKHILGSPLLLIQVTRLKCKGFVLAVRFKHTMCDSTGLVQFLNAVCELARGGAQAPSLLPVWERDILNAQHPPGITFIHHEFEEVYKTKSTLRLMDDNNTVHRHVFFGPKDITALKSWILQTHGPCTTYEALAACVWRCRTAAFRLHPDEVVRFSSTVNVRGRPGGLEIPPGYYGNAFAYPAEVATAGEVCGNPLGHAVGLVKKGKKVEMIGDYLKSTAALMVSKGRPPYTPEGLFIVSDNTRVGYQELDFGWGKPLYGGIADAVFLLSFFTRFRNREGEEGVVVPICLPPPVVERFEEEVKKMINISTAAQEKY